MIVILLLDIVCSLGLHWLFGRLRSILLLLALVLRLSSCFGLYRSGGYLVLLLLQDLGVAISSPTPLHCESTRALQVTADPTKHELTKHVGVDAHFTRCSVRDQTVSLHYLPTKVQVAEFFTKAQTRDQHLFLLSKLKTIDPS